MCAVLIVVLPALAIMWGEMKYATEYAHAVANKALDEAKQLKDLRQKIFNDFYREE
jgi:hypothetical protein